MRAEGNAVNRTDDAARRGIVPMPRAPGWDQSLALMADPYRYIARQARQLGSDVFAARLMLRPAVCMTGPDAARLFYDPERFQREGAAPEPVRSTLFGHGGVQGLDGDTHRRRKALFVEAVRPDEVTALVATVREEWELSLPAWQRGGRIAVYPALQPILARAVCRWAGVPLAERELPRRQADLVALFDAAAAGPLQHLRSRVARWRLEGMLRRWLQSVREGRHDISRDSPAERIVFHVDAQGHWLPAQTAAVELLNLLRPVVAVSLYMSFVAHALQAHADWRDRLATSGAESSDGRAFAQEVRRDYPFFPALMARVREDFEWRGLHFARGTRTLLDIHGTHHDARAWRSPAAFRPERWLDGPVPPFGFLPQGAGDVATHHRCPGEDIALRLMQLAIDMFTRRLRYEVPPQDLSLRLRRLPAMPRDGFVIDRVELDRYA